MPFEEVVDFFCGHREIFTVEVFEKDVIIFEGGEPSTFSVDAPEGVPYVDLAQLVSSVQFQLVFKL